MITHELALELKNAGFPQQGDGKYVGNVGNISGQIEPGEVFGIAQEDFFYIPTLSELIEACGDKFSKLYTNDQKKWYAESLIDYRLGTGSTPREAVAKLYLDIKKHENKK